MGSYNPYEYAISLGFSETEAAMVGKANADATNIRRVAAAKGLATKPEPKAKAKPTASDKSNDN